MTRSSGLNNDAKKDIKSTCSMGGLPHPSKLKKRKQKRLRRANSLRQNQYGFDVTAHVSQLKRKHAEFNW